MHVRGTGEAAPKWPHTFRIRKCDRARNSDLAAHAFELAPVRLGRGQCEEREVRRPRNQDGLCAAGRYALPGGQPIARGESPDNTNHNQRYPD